METQRYDVVVVGGGAGGVAAAIGAAQTGARVALIERSGFLGGTATNSSVLAYCGFFSQDGDQVVRGVGQQFLERLDDHDLRHIQKQPYSGNTIVLLDRETTKRCLDELVISAGVELYLHAQVVSASSEPTTDDSARRVTAVNFVHRGGNVTLEAGTFVDASGDAVLATAVGAEVLVSPPAERQAATLVMHIGGVPESASRPSPQDFAEAMDAYQEETGVHLSRSNTVCVRSPLTGELMLLFADEHFDALDVTEITRAEISARRQTAHIFAALKTGLAGWEESYLSHTGPQIGVRETRRIAGRSTITTEDIHGGTRDSEKGIARCGWPIEDHSRPGETTYTPIGEHGWYHISGDALASRSHTNLWAAGRIVSSEPRAYASVRVMGTAFATGHAAGVYAALASRDPSQSHNHRAAREELLRQNAEI